MTWEYELSFLPGTKPGLLSSSFLRHYIITLKGPFIIQKDQGILVLKYRSLPLILKYNHSSILACKSYTKK